MGEKYEDSHVENIDRFGKIVKLCEAYGTDYNPSNPELSIANMTLRKEGRKMLSGFVPRAADNKDSGILPPSTTKRSNNGGTAVLIPSDKTRSSAPHHIFCSQNLRLKLQKQSA